MKEVIKKVIAKTFCKWFRLVIKSDIDHYIEVRKSTRNILKPISAMFIEPIPLMIFYGFETFENHQILEKFRTYEELITDDFIWQNPGKFKSSKKNFN